MDYLNPGPNLEEISKTKGPLLLEFGTDWCGYCQGAAPIISEALAKATAITHIKIEDGKGRALGRAFHVKLWPTLIVLKDGVEVARSVRPTDSDELLAAIRQVL